MYKSTAEELTHSFFIFDFCREPGLVRLTTEEPRGGMAGSLDSTQALLDYTIQVTKCSILSCPIFTKRVLAQDSCLQDSSEDEVFFGAVHSVEKMGRSNIR